MAEAAVRQGLSIAASAAWMLAMLTGWITLGCSGHRPDALPAPSESEPQAPTSTYPIPSDLLARAAAPETTVEAHKEPPRDEIKPPAPPAEAQRLPPLKTGAAQHSDSRHRTAPSASRRVVASSTPPAPIPARRSADPVPTRPPAETDSRRRIPLVDDSARVRIVD
jgi:hypothetical protein